MAAEKLSVQVAGRVLAASESGYYAWGFGRRRYGRSGMRGSTPTKTSTPPVLLDGLGGKLVAFVPATLEGFAQLLTITAPMLNRPRIDRTAPGVIAV